MKRTRIGRFNVSGLHPSSGDGGSYSPLPLRIRCHGKCKCKKVHIKFETDLHVCIHHSCLFTLHEGEGDIETSVFSSEAQCI